MSATRRKQSSTPSWDSSEASTRLAEVAQNTRGLLTLVGSLNERLDRARSDDRKPGRWSMAIAAVGLVLTATATVFGALSLAGLAKSLQREEISVVELQAEHFCANDANQLAALIGESILTNTGRMPITVIHVGAGGPWVNQWSYAKLDADPMVAKGGAALLGPGEAIAVYYSVLGRTLPSQVEAVLSNGTTVQAHVIQGGRISWPVLQDSMTVDSKVECPAGTHPAEVPLADLVPRGS